MAIAFSCTCGKVMKAKEAYAGRKVRCPQCDKVVTIPQTATGDEDLTVTPVPSEPVAPLLAKPVVRPSVAKAKENADPVHTPKPPPARPVAQLAAAEPKAEPPARPAAASLHAWVDQSLTQRPTPWLPGDEERFQKGISAPREGMGGLEKGVLGLLVLAGVAAAGWFMIALR